MPSTDQTRIDIIGIGAIAEVIARGVNEIIGATLVAACSRTQAKGKSFVERFGGEWFADVEQMIDGAQPHVAIICTPSGAHLEPALACIARGVDVVVEKPLEITMARGRAMIDAAQRAGVRVGGIFPQRFNPVNAAVHEAAKAGRFGNLAVIHATVPWWRDDAYYAPHRWQGKRALDGGGALMNQAIHTVDLMQWIAAATLPNPSTEENSVEEVFSFTAKRGHDINLIETEDTAVVTLRFRNGALGQLLAATSMYPGQRRRLQVSGRDGSAEVVEDELVTWRFRAESPDDESIRARFAKATEHEGGSSNPMAIDYIPHRRNIEDFLSAWQENREPLLTGPESLKAVAIIEACYESARTGKPVRVESISPSPSGRGLG